MAAIGVSLQHRRVLMLGGRKTDGQSSLKLRLAGRMKSLGLRTSVLGRAVVTSLVGANGERGTESDSIQPIISHLMSLFSVSFV